MITAARLRELLTYDPATGVFRWRVDRLAGQYRTRVLVRAGSVAGSLCPRGYLQIRVDDKLYLAHRLAWFYMTGEWPVNGLDHKDLNKSNNRWKNLRAATKSQNGANRPKQSNNTSGFKGVTWDSWSAKWLAQIAVEGKRINLGRFTSKPPAIAAYRQAAEKHFGEFARSS